MKLSSECIRDILLFLEEQPFFALTSEGGVTAQNVQLGEIAD